MNNYTKNKMFVPTTEVEAAFWARGLLHVAGLDEAGRGAWAGPVTAAAVVLPRELDKLERLSEIRDSKTLSPQRREEFMALVANVALAVGVGWADAREIDNLGIVPATRLAMARAVAALPTAPEALVIDALTLPELTQPQEAFPYADARCLSVAAAGIVAKVSRDRWMVERAEVEFPGYGFASHKGYGTPQHRQALSILNACNIHRRSFRPIAARIAGEFFFSEG